MADEPKAATPDGQVNNPEPDKGQAPTEPADTEKVFKQADLDRIIEQRLNRERKAWEATLKAEKDKAAMSEAERLKAEKDEAEKRAADSIATANARLVTARAEVALASAGIKPDRIARAIRLLDLSDIAVSESGDPDGAAIKAAVDALLAEWPELKGAAAAAGGDFSKANPADAPLNDDIIAKMKPDELKRRMPEIRAYYAAKK